MNSSPLICSTQNQHPQTYQANVGPDVLLPVEVHKKLHGGYIYSGDLKSAENSNRGSMTEMQHAGKGIKADFQ